jgi:glycosyltransferase involved in cell wall biosynthesis
MCTYNGAAFVPEQLNSIARQTRPPHEIVVCDDGSTDPTVAIVEDFSRDAAIKVRVERNATRLGPAKNFEWAISLCTGDLIALADQDDIWLPDKLARLAGAMRGGAPYAFCDATLVEESLLPVGGKSLLARRFSLKSIASKFDAGCEFDLMLKRDFIYGTTMMLRADLRERVFPIPERWSHDTWIVNMTAAFGGHGVPVLEPLQFYRQHSEQHSGGMGAPKHVPETEQALAHEELLRRIELHTWATGERPQPDVVARIEEKIRYLRAVARMQRERQPRRAMTAAAEVLSGRWWRYSPRTYRRPRRLRRFPFLPPLPDR